MVLLGPLQLFAARDKLTIFWLSERAEKFACRGGKTDREPPGRGAVVPHGFEDAQLYALRSPTRS
jgi:hypothetical protein